MGDTDKQYFEWFYRKIQAEGVPAVWTGSERHCGNYPALVAGMPGLYIWLSGNRRDFSTFRRKKRILARNTPIYGGYHANSQ